MGFKFSNKIRSLNRLFFIFLIILLVLIINIISSRYYYRTYINNNTRYKLSEETISKISEISKEIKIFVLLEHSDSLALNVVKNDISKLLNEYIECSNLISAKFLDFNHENYELRSLSNKVGILPNNVVVVQSEDSVKVLSIEEFYEIHNGEVVGFCGERLLTSTISNLESGYKKNIYFISGHGEYNIDDTSSSFGLSALANILRQKNYNVQTLNLSIARHIPENADLIFITGLKVPFLFSEINILKDFLDKNGGNIIFTVSETKDRLLNEFVLDHGIYINQDCSILPCEKDAKFNNDLTINKFAHHEITDSLINLKLPIVWGHTCEVNGAELATDDVYQITDLIEVDGITERDLLKEDSFIVCSLFEKSIFNEIDVLNGKLLVIGSSDFLTNSKINILGNKIFLCNAVDFMCNSKVDLSIASKNFNKYRLSIQPKQFSIIICNLVLICCLTCFLGVIVFWMRRK